MPRSSPYMGWKVTPRFRELRGELRLKAVETETGIAAGTLSQIEHGQRLPLPKQMEPLERVYGPRIAWYMLELVEVES